eukprot:761277-Hanusia_phi.AAC.1
MRGGRGRDRRGFGWKGEIDRSSAPSLPPRSEERGEEEEEEEEQEHAIVHHFFPLAAVGTCQQVRQAHRSASHLLTPA